ncbi:MAG TPA: hypothetical protein VK646_09680 [Actinomycetota bacterium]|nr:hypothetical protein [Actinomycetota bacterium]
MAQTADHVIELLVGLVCLGLAAPAWTRGGGGRVVAVVLAIAGLAAAGHAVVALVQ